MVYYGNVIYSPYISHHGIKGQKWGVRRFQNEDGSYTQLGKARYAKDKQIVKETKAIMKQDKKDYKSGKISKEEYGMDQVIANTIYRNAKESRREIRYEKAADAGRAAYAKTMAKTNDPGKANKKAEKAYYKSIANRWLGGGLLDAGPMLADYKKAKNKRSAYDFSLSAKQIAERPKMMGKEFVITVLTDDYKKNKKR